MFSICINLKLTNQKKYILTFEAGISDKHKLILSVGQSRSFKGRPQEKICRSIDLLIFETFKKRFK